MQTTPLFFTLYHILFLLSIVFLKNTQIKNNIPRVLYFFLVYDKIKYTYIIIIVKRGAFYDKIYKKATARKAYSGGLYACYSFGLVIAYASDKPQRRSKASIYRFALYLGKRSLRYRTYNR
jgi:hypothetical protein